MKRAKRGIYFTLDAIFGAFIIVAAVTLYLTFSQYQQDPSIMQDTASDGMRVLNTLALQDTYSLNATLHDAVLGTGLVNESDPVIRVIGVLWATNNSLAPVYTQAVFTAFLPQYSYSVYAETDLLYSRALTPESQAVRIASAKQQVSGIAFNQPVTGTTATAFLKKIENKTTNSFVYFGGFVGQGNLTFQLTDLPADISASNIRDVTLEVDTPSPFTLYINGQNCGDFVPTGAGNSSVERWAIATCYDQFQSGSTTVAIVFNATVDNSYLSGGYLRVGYVTQYEISDPYATPQTVNLPGITGIVNLYDSFFVPGNITSMQIYLHYLANHTGALQNNSFYITVGNTTVYRENFSTSVQSVLLTDINLSGILNYSMLSQQTIPFRVGFENLSFATTYSGNANVMLVTDVSGSMGYEMDSTNGGVARLCTDPLINASTTQRISVAKCLDKQFAQDILNLSGNWLGLVSYQTSTNNVTQLTTNLTYLNNTINNYGPGSSTCICCGINSATAQLNRSVLQTNFLSAGATGWRYTFIPGTSLSPANDSGGLPWYDPDYADENTWSVGQAVLGGNENGSGPLIVTDMGSSMLTNRIIVNLWDMVADNGTPEVDFTSGMNNTSNTYGVTGGNDGWDWKAGVFDFTSTNMIFRGAQSGRIEMQTGSTATGNNRNNCGTFDCSGAYGILINITPTAWATLQANGHARLSFNYEWNSPLGGVFEGSDEMWIKARWNTSGGVVTYLGSELSSSGSDATYEIDFEDDPDSDILAGGYSQDVTTLITGAGLYYLELGGKLQANANDEWGYFRFDNVLLTITNQTDSYYLRKNFTISNLSYAQTTLLNVLSDDRATVYLNGQLLVDELQSHSAEYWNVHGVPISQNLLQVGTNVLAIRIENIADAAKIDARVHGLNVSKNLAMLVMTDGQANVNCTGGSSQNAREDAIEAACIAREEWGITVHAVGFSDMADNYTLQNAALCGAGLYTASSNTSDLSDFYRNVAYNILDGSLKSQSIVLNSSYQASILYDDSYLRFDHVPAYPALRQNEITVKTQSNQFGTCTPNVYLNPNTRVLAAELTSYSGSHWTDLVTANGNTVYNLSVYNSPYIVLGDPYIVHLPPPVLIPGNNAITMRTGDSPLNSTGCSENNSLITTLGIQLATAYTPVLTQATGCVWTIEHDDLTSQVISVPKTYSGSNTCAYTNASISYNVNDAYDVGTAGLLQSLDYDRDGRIFISLAEEDIEIIVNTVSNVPYLWGPSLFEVRVWQ